MAGESGWGGAGPGCAAHGQPVGTSVVQLQASLPNARVMYLSATGATQVGDMSYMTLKAVPPALIETEAALSLGTV